MSGPTYLEKLNVRLAAGAARLPAELIEPLRSFLITSQRSDGGFAGREGDSDLYYTGFALRGLAVANAFKRQVRDQAAGFIRARLGQPASIIDFVSLLYAGRLIHATGGADVLTEHSPDWADRVAAALETYRSPDGGYAKNASAAMGSTYHTFLVALAYEMIGRTLPEPARVIEFVTARRRDDGGFVELPVMKRSGANPTAAAVALLMMLQNVGGASAPRLPESLAESGRSGPSHIPELALGAVDCLAALQSPEEGGFCANRSMPVADLLSTFTVVLTLQDLGAFGRVDRESARDYVASLVTPAGGFRGGVWDDQADVEYTFYGLGALALLESGVS